MPSTDSDRWFAYGVYVRTGAGPFSLYAYLNLTRLRDSYPIYQCRGAKDALLAIDAGMADT